MSNDLFRPHYTFLINHLRKLYIEFGLNLQCGEGSFFEICERYQSDVARYKNPDLIKRASCLAFWIKKLKPIHLLDNTPLFINEMFAHICAHSILEKYYELKESTPEIYNDIMYSFRYRVASPQHLFTYFQILYRRK